jgi:plastocyanin
MKTDIRFISTAIAGIAVLAILLGVQSVWATTHIVQFGGGLGLVFSPKSFNATVGDTVTWNGDFTMHTTTSTSVPTNAATWNFGLVSATTFSYVIRVAGAYAYQCNVHVASGMVGSFTATASGVRSDPPLFGAGTDGRISVIAVAKTGSPVVQFFVPSTQPVTLEIINLRGESVATVINTTLSAGTYTVPLGNKIRAAGVYFFRLNGRGAEHHGAIRLL